MLQSHLRNEVSIKSQRHSAEDLDVWPLGRGTRIHPCARRVAHPNYSQDSFKSHPLFLAALRFEIALARQALYDLSHSTSPKVGFLWHAFKYLEDSMYV
jgi:hypothetical protein